MNACGTGISYVFLCSRLTDFKLEEKMKGIRFYRHVALALALSLQAIKAQDLGISHFRVHETGVTLEVDVPQGWGRQAGDDAITL